MLPERENAVLGCCRERKKAQGFSFHEKLRNLAAILFATFDRKRTGPKKLVKSQQTPELWHNSFRFHLSLRHFAPDKAYEVKC